MSGAVVELARDLAGSSQIADREPHNSALPRRAHTFVMVPEAGEVACTEPARLAGNTGNYRGGYFSLVTSNPTFAAPGFRPTDVTTRFLLYRDFFKGSCVARDGFNYLELSIAKSADDTRETPPYRSAALETNGWGLHLVDYNPELEDLIEMVKLQAAAAR